MTLNEMMKLVAAGVKLVVYDDDTGLHTDELCPYDWEESEPDTVFQLRTLAGKVVIKIEPAGRDLLYIHVVALLKEPKGERK